MLLTMRMTSFISIRFLLILLRDDSLKLKRHMRFLFLKNSKSRMMIDKSTAVKILTECQNKQKWFLKFLEKLVEIETPPHNPKSHKQVFTVLEKTLSDLGYRTMITTGSRSGGQLFARRPGHPEKGYQLWIGHIDTV